MSGNWSWETGDILETNEDAVLQNNTHMPWGDANMCLWIMKQLAQEGRWHMVEPFFNLPGRPLDIRTVNQRLESGNYANAANLQSELQGIPTSFLTETLSRAREKASDLLQELPTLFKRRQMQDTRLRKRSQQQQQQASPQQPQQQQQQQGQEPTNTGAAPAVNQAQAVPIVGDNQAALSATGVNPPPPAPAESALPSRRSLSIRPADRSATSQVEPQVGEAQTSGTGTTEREAETIDSIPDQNVIEQSSKHSAKRAASPQEPLAAKRPRQDVSSSKSVVTQASTQNLAYTPALHNAIEAAMVREARIIAEMQKSANLEGDRRKYLQRASLTKKQRVRETIEGELKRDHVRAIAASMHEEIHKASMGILDRLIAEEVEYKQQEKFDQQQKEIDELKWTVGQQQHTIDEQQKLIASLQQTGLANDEEMGEETIEEARAGKKRQH